jgi:radical SAM protein with 4Fe4S-binding SPASM domain
VSPVMSAMITGHTIPGNMHDLFTKIHDTLPVFKISLVRQMVLYTPGYSIKTAEIPSGELQSLFMNPAGIPDGKMRVLVMAFLEKAKANEIKWGLQQEAPFIPECLTIHVGNECNLNCSYCYAAIDRTANRNIKGFPPFDAIISALDCITESVPGNSKRLTVSYHGSGEPAFHWSWLTDAFRHIELFAAQKNIHLFSYIATNGCLDEVQTDWLAEHMDLIGISCDGPPDIQMAQRKTDLTNYLSIEQVCKRILNKGGRFDIRVTVTRDTVLRMPEITRYLIEKCRAGNIRIEPVYLAGDNAFKEEDAEVFFDHLIQSAKIANNQGVGFGYSGIRMEELHGTYCDVSRNTVRLTADGKTRNCFCFMSDKNEFQTGGYNEFQSLFSLRTDIDELKSKAYRIPDVCSKCINIFHCSRGCPDFCLFDNGYEEHQQLNPFKCRLHQLIAVSHAIATAKTYNTSNFQ